MDKEDSKRLRAWRPNQQPGDRSSDADCSRTSNLADKRSNQPDSILDIIKGPSKRRRPNWISHRTFGYYFPHSLPSRFISSSQVPNLVE